MPLAIDNRPAARRSPTCASAGCGAASSPTAASGSRSASSTTCPTRRWPRPQRQFARLIEAASGEFDVRLQPVRSRDAAALHETRRAMAERLSRGARARGRAARRDHRHRRRAARRRPDAGALLARTPALCSTGPTRGRISTLLPASRRMRGRCAATASPAARLAAKCSGVFAIEVLADHELTAGLERGLCDAALALERARRSRTRRQGLPHADPLGRGGRRHLRPQEAQPAASSCRAIPNTTPTRWPASIAATCCASCAARRAGSRACRPTISRARRRRARRFRRPRRVAARLRARGDLSRRRARARRRRRGATPACGCARNWLRRWRGARRREMRPRLRSPAGAARRAALDGLSRKPRRRDDGNPSA